MKNYYGNPTLTVKELREILLKYPDDMPVLATWEGILTCFHVYDERKDTGFEARSSPSVETAEEVWNGAGKCWDDAVKEPCLVFDVDDY